MGQSPDTGRHHTQDVALFLERESFDLDYSVGAEGFLQGSLAQRTNDRMARTKTHETARLLESNTRDDQDEWVNVFDKVVLDMKGEGLAEELKNMGCHSSSTAVCLSNDRNECLLPRKVNLNMLP